ncbi:hypothetical protein LX36DRAFT_77014 [Colletotrichum falcatum]|nr:hypothetical protein LX36DRAFT_77014 [Colletotrichum falcatum]
MGNASGWLWLVGCWVGGCARLLRLFFSSSSCSQREMNRGRCIGWLAKGSRQDGKRNEGRRWDGREKQRREGRYWLYAAKRAQCDQLVADLQCSALLAAETVEACFAVPRKGIT